MNVLNQTEFGLEVQLGGEGVLELKTGECSSLTQDQLLQLSLEKVTGWADLALDSVVCNNFASAGADAQGKPQCQLTKMTVYAENEEEDAVLMEYQAPAKDSEEEAADFSKCKPVEDPEDSDEDEEEEDTEEE